MKAAIYTKYGAPDVLQIGDTEKPVPNKNEVLVRVFASTVTSGDANVRGFVFVPKGLKFVARITFGLRAPKKKVLGFVQSSTEHHQPISDLLRDLLARGLKTREKVLVCIDGSKGIRKAVKTVFEGKALIQRCQWHKRENVASYLRVLQRRLQLVRVDDVFPRVDFGLLRHVI